MPADQRSKLSPRERVCLALNHREPDRVPLDLGSTGNTGITAIAYRRLLTYLGIVRLESRFPKTFRTATIALALLPIAAFAATGYIPLRPSVEQQRLHGCEPQ